MTSAKDKEIEERLRVTTVVDIRLISTFNFVF